MSEINLNEFDTIKASVNGILNSISPDVLLVAASKTRTPEEVQAAVDAGIKTIGYNYVQEAERMYQFIGNRVKWHLIGHLQQNKVKKAVGLFDMIETIDSFKLADAVNKQCTLENKIMPVLIEINSGKESNKTGVLPENVDDLALSISDLPNLQVKGLMTMGPRFGNPEDARPYFEATKNTFYRLKN